MEKLTAAEFGVGSDVWKTKEPIDIDKIIEQIENDMKFFYDFITN